MPSPRLSEAHGQSLARSGVREPGGVHSQVAGRRFPPSEQLIHPVKGLGVKAPECLLEEGITWRPLKTEKFKELRV